MTVYEASPIKRRRSTKAEIEALCSDLYAIVAEQKPMIVRQAYYQASVRGLVDKTENGYRQVQRLLANMRRSGQMPYGWIVDNSRPCYMVDSFEGPADAIAATARFYRKALWADANVRVEVWLEKDALSGVLLPVTQEYDVGLYISRGFASLSFLSGSAEAIANSAKPTVIYHLGDFDPSGVMAGNKIEETLREFAPDAELTFVRLAVTPAQIAEWSLPSRPTKASTHTKGWRGDSVELDAIPPDTLRKLVRDAIEHHLPREQFDVLKVAEKSEQDFLNRWAEEICHG